MRPAAIWVLSSAAFAALVAMLAVRQVRKHDALRTGPTSAPAVQSGAASVADKSAEDGALQGEVDARADIAAGVLGWKELGGWGLIEAPKFESVGMADILQRDFGVRLSRTPHGGCMLPPDSAYQSERTRAYNDVMKPAIIAKHGADVFEVADARAKAENDRRGEKRESREDERPKPKVQKPSSSIARAPISPGCDPPFFRDERGVRRVKPGCM